MFPQPVLGVVEAMISGKSGKGSGPERGRGSVKLKEKRVGVPTKKTPAAPRTRQMTMAGPQSAAERPLLHPIGLVNDELVLKEVIFSIPSAS